MISLKKYNLKHIKNKKNLNFFKNIFKTQKQTGITLLTTTTPLPPSLLIYLFLFNNFIFGFLDRCS